MSRVLWDYSRRLLTRVSRRLAAKPRLHARTGTWLLAGLSAATLALPAQDAPHTSAPAAQPATRPAGPVPFQPGVKIDWQERAVIVASRVVLREGPLEFFACRPGKEHESILRLEASATHIYMALGLIGLLPGQPPVWDEARGEYARPAGDLVEISCQWDADGQVRSAEAYDWLREIEYARKPAARPWVFAGSLPLPDGTLAADRTGAVIALVDFPESLLAQSRAFASRYGELWAEVNTEAVPPLGTPVRLILRPARSRPRQVTVDFRGQVFIDGRYAAPPDLADLLKLDRQLDPNRVQVILLRGTLRTDAAGLQRELAKLGVPNEAVRLESDSSAPAPERRAADHSGSD